VSHPIPGHPRYELAASDGEWIVIGPRGPMKGWIQPDPTKEAAPRRYFNLDQQTMQLARIVLLALVGPPPEGLPFACHANGDPLDNRLENLYWGSYLDNAADASRHGVHMAQTPRGEAHYKALPQSVIDAVRAEYVPRSGGQPKGHRGGLLPGSLRWLAAKYGLTQATVYKIVSNKTRRAA
jgi:hypothetical protein